MRKLDHVQPFGLSARQLLSRKDLNWLVVRRGGHP